jgi:hypothetical protein
MKCHRCHGWMVNEKFYGRGSFFWGWRCVSCGEILDPVILENRNVCRRSPSPRHSGLAVENSGRR